jgi:hypothetical protein
MGGGGGSSKVANPKIRCNKRQIANYLSNFGSWQKVSVMEQV